MHQSIATHPLRRLGIFVAVFTGLALSVCSSTSAQDAWKPTCQPVAARTTDRGCWIVASESLGQLPKGPLFWHLYSYESRSAAQAVKRQGETVVESLGKVWLTTIAPAGWKPSGGERVSEIGPLPVIAGEAYMAQSMEAIFPPGFDTPVHRHPGPEAWYTVAGEVCLETPGQKAVGRAGDKDGVIVPGGQPMRLSVTGTELRRSLVLILHESSKPHTVPASDWKPEGLCKR